MATPDSNLKKKTTAGSPTAEHSKKHSSEGSSIFFEGTDKWEESFSTVLIRQVLKKGSFASITYPYKFAFFLAKLGYIPKSLAEYFNLDNQKVLRIPSITEYMNFMKSNEGDSLWMRGEIAFCSTFVLYAVVEICVTEYLMGKSKLNKSLREEYLECLFVTSKTVLVAVVITQPFTMLSYRQIGQYVGKEEIYSSALAFFKVFSKPGILSFIEVTLARYISHVIPTVCGNLAILSWDHWG
uniref:Uncharacterized protein n=1 Tax=Lygus hesperus TaxID=30085 RepID=A0A0A9ZAT1_LYGHE